VVSVPSSRCTLFTRGLGAIVVCAPRNLFGSCVTRGFGAIVVCAPRHLFGSCITGGCSAIVVCAPRHLFGLCATREYARERLVDNLLVRTFCGPCCASVPRTLEPDGAGRAGGGGADRAGGGGPAAGRASASFLADQGVAANADARRVSSSPGATAAPTEPSAGSVGAIGAFEFEAAAAALCSFDAVLILDEARLRP